MKTKHFLIMLFITLVLGAGCWSSHELEELGLISAIGVDYKEGKYDLTIQVIKPDKIGQGSAKEAVSTIYCSGATMFDAVRNAISYSPQRLYWGYLQVAVFSQESLDKGLACLTDFLTRDFEIRPILWVAVTEKSARDLLKATVAMDIPSGEGLNNLFTTQKVFGKCVHSMLTQVVIALGNEGKDFACTLLGTREVEGETFIEIKGTTLFRNETFAGNIDTLTSRGLLWLMDRVEGGIIVLEKDSEKLSLEILSAKTKIKTRVKGDEISFEINIEVASNLAEQTADLNPSKPSLWKELALYQANHVKKEAEDALSVIRELGSDPVGFGKLVRAFYPRKWYEIRGNWHDIFKTVPITINVKSQLRATGMTLGDAAIYGTLETK